MAIRKFEVPGKIITSTPAQVFIGPTGQYGWGTSAFVAPQQLYQEYPNYTVGAETFVGTVSFWYRFTSTSSDANVHLNFETINGTHDFSSIGQSSGAIRIILRDDLKNALIDVTGSSAGANSAWHHVLLSWDINTGNTYADDFHMYLDDVSVKPVSPATFGVGTPVEWGAGNQFIAQYRMGFVDSATVLPGVAHSAYWLSINQYVDFSVTANRRKFIDSSGDPVALGIDGSRPTGTAPEFYLDNPAASLLTNRGSAGNLTTLSTLADQAGPNP